MLAFCVRHGSRPVSTTGEGEDGHPTPQGRRVAAPRRVAPGGACGPEPADRNVPSCPPTRFPPCWVRCLPWETTPSGTLRTKNGETLPPIPMATLSCGHHAPWADPPEARQTEGVGGGRGGSGGGQQPQHDASWGSTPGAPPDWMALITNRLTCKVGPPRHHHGPRRSWPQAAGCRGPQLDACGYFARPLCVDDPFVFLLWPQEYM